MKHLIFIISLIFIGYSNSYSQNLNTDGLNNLDNVFLYSLKEYCNSLDSLNTKKVYVRRDHFIGENWPTKIKNFEIKYLENTEYKAIIKQNGGEAIIVGICPFEYKNSLFSVSIIPFSATYSKKSVTLKNGGGLTVYFEYDNDKKALIYKTKNWYGI